MKYKELKTSNNKSNFKDILSIPLIMNQIYQFLDKEDIKCLYLCSQKTYEIYYNQIEKLTLNEDIEPSNLSKINFDKYKNLLKLDLYHCLNIRDFSFISSLKQLVYLDINDTEISDISFLGKNKNIKELNLYECRHVKDYSIISNLKKLEKLNLGKTNVSDISFLINNKNIK